MLGTFLNVGFIILRRPSTMMSRKARRMRTTMSYRVLPSTISNTSASSSSQNTTTAWPAMTERSNEPLGRESFHEAPLATMALSISAPVAPMAFTAATASTRLFFTFIARFNDLNVAYLTCEYVLPLLVNLATWHDTCMGASCAAALPTPIHDSTMATTTA